MRKTLAVLMALTLLFVGAETALAALPHCHGADFDHSHHRACPVHQVELHGVDFAAAPEAALTFTPVFVFLRERPVVETASHVLRSATSRAPPPSV